MKFIIVSLLSNLFLFANSANIENKETYLSPLAWLILALIIVGLLFWSFYKALKSKNPKYGYLIAFLIILLAGLLFV